MAAMPWLGAVLALGGVPAVSWGSGLSAEPAPMLEEEQLPARTAPIIELGQSFLGSGEIKPGFTLPTGAVWQPALWLFGGYRTALDAFDRGDGQPRTSEWVNRLDLYFNLQLSGTERVLWGLQPLSHNADFTGYFFDPGDGEYHNAVNERTTTLFFEGQLSQLFPGLDPDNQGRWDYGFAVGRQPLFFQEGIMLNDSVDAIGVSRESIILPGVVSGRVTGIYGWDNIHRGDNIRDDSARLYGLFTEWDLRASTIDLDIAYVSADKDAAGKGGDGLYLGAGAVQRIGGLNTAFWLNTSKALDEESPAISDGTVVLAEVSTTPRRTDNVAYLDAFWGIDDYTSAARDPTAGGPLGRTGLLFSAVGLGRYPAALGNQAARSAGAAVGYQMFFNGERTQLTVELGTRRGTEDGAPEDMVAVGARLQHALGRRVLVQLDGFLAQGEVSDRSWGLRSELAVRF